MIWRVFQVGISHDHGNGVAGDGSGTGWVSSCECYIAWPQWDCCISSGYVWTCVGAGLGLSFTWSWCVPLTLLLSVVSVCWEQGWEWCSPATLDIENSNSSTTI